MDWVLRYVVHRNLVIHHYFIAWLYLLPLLTKHTCNPLLYWSFKPFFEREACSQFHDIKLCIAWQDKHSMPFYCCLLLANLFHWTQYRISNTMNTLVNVIYFPVWSEMLVMLSVTRCVPNTMIRAGSFQCYLVHVKIHMVPNLYFCSQLTWL